MRQARPNTFAAAQTVPGRGDVDANTEDHQRFVRAAAAVGVDTLVFPELSLTGYELDLANDLAFVPDDLRLAPLRELAASNNMTLIVGAPVRIGSALHIGAFIVSPDRTLGLYTKRHLGAGEGDLLQPGRLDPLVPCGSESAAIAVCADANHPTHPQEAARRGARVYLVSTFITSAQLGDRTTMLREYACRHSLTVVFANYGGPSGGLDAGGRSAIWSAKGELLAQLEGNGPGLVVASEGDRGWSGRAITFYGP